MVESSRAALSVDLSLAFNPERRPPTPALSTTVRINTVLTGDRYRRTGSYGDVRGRKTPRCAVTVKFSALFCSRYERGGKGGGGLVVREGG